MFTSGGKSIIEKKKAESKRWRGGGSKGIREKDSYLKGQRAGKLQEVTVFT